MCKYLARDERRRGDFKVEQSLEIQVLVERSSPSNDGSADNLFVEGIIIRRPM